MPVRGRGRNVRENVRSTFPRAAELEFYLRGSVGVHAERRTESLVRHGAMAASASGRLIRRITSNYLVVRVHYGARFTLQSPVTTEYFLDLASDHIDCMIHDSHYCDIKSLFRRLNIFHILWLCHYYVL